MRQILNSHHRAIIREPAVGTSTGKRGTSNWKLENENYQRGRKEIKSGGAK